MSSPETWKLYLSTEISYVASFMIYLHICTWCQRCRYVLFGSRYCCI